MKLYGNDFSPNSNKVRYAANAMNLNYEFVSINLAAGEQRKEEFLKVNPIGRVPALSEGSFVMIESNAIMRYLAEKNNSPLYPKDIEKHSLVNQWMDFGSIHVGAGGMNKVFFNTIVYKMVNAPIDERSLTEGRQFLGNYLKLLDGQLGKAAYLCGNEMTLADLNLLAILDPSEVVGFDLTAYPKVSQWRTALQTQSFYRKLFPETYTGFINQMLGAAK